MGSTEFLGKYPVLRTRDLDVARLAVSEHYCDHRLSLARGRTLNVRHNHVRGAHVSLNLLGYGGHVRIEPGLLNEFYLVQIPLAGAARICHRGEEVDAGPARATVLSPDRPSIMEWSADCLKLMVQVDAGFLHRVAEEMTGAPLPGPVRFDPSIDLTRDEGRHLKTKAVAAARAIDAGALNAAAQGLTEMWTERDIARALLSLQPSNISHLLEQGRDRTLSAQVRRAIAFIHCAHAQQIRLEDIAAASEMHPRTLQIRFRDAVGVTPMTYLRNVRLDAARYQLSARARRESVTDVAFGCGFTHLGRFSKDYQERFGHLPSEAP